jgi:hypothetical protein
MGLVDNAYNKISVIKKELMTSHGGQHRSLLAITLTILDASYIFRHKDLKE